MTAPGLAFERVRRESLARPQVPGTALSAREYFGLPCPAASPRACLVGPQVLWTALPGHGEPEVTKKPHRPGLAV